MTDNRLTRLLQLAYLWFPVAIVIVLYHSVSGHGFVWDDAKAFLRYPFYTNLDYLLRAFREPLVFWPDYYRPLTSSSYILQISWLGLKPSHLHLVNLALHCANTVLVAIISRRLIGDRLHGPASLWVPVIPPLIFALHPALIESVSWVSDRFDLLTTFFMLLAYVADSGLKHRLARPLVTGLLFFLAALSKEMAVAFALALPFWHLAQLDRKPFGLRESIRELYRRGDFQVYASVFLFGLLYLGVRYAALGYLVSENDHSRLTGNSALPHLLLVFRSYAEYLRLILFPFGGISPVHPVSLPLNPAEVTNWLLASVLVLALVTAALVIRKRPQPGWLLLALLASLVPIANIGIIQRPPASFFSESYLVFPMAMFAIWIASIMPLSFASGSRAKIRGRVAATVATVGIWLVAGVFTIVTTVPLWKNDRSLWLWAAVKHPESTTALINASSALADSNDYRSALTFAKKALALDRGNPVAWAAAGRAQTWLGQYQQAEESFKKSIDLKLANPEAWLGLAQLLQQQHKHADAIQILENVVLQNEPDNILALVYLSQSYRATGENRKAKVLYEKLLKLAPSTGLETFIKSSLAEIKDS